MSNYWFISSHDHRHAKVALIAFLLGFIVVLLGAYTRLTDAGLSCPDWPHCYGYLTAPHTSSQLETAAQLYPHSPVNVTKAWTEMVHRYFAGFEGLLILFFAASIWSKRKNFSINTKALPFILIGILIIQVLLGMLTVTAKLKPIIVLGHLLTGISLLSVLWCSYLSFAKRKTVTMVNSQSIGAFLVLGAVLVFLQISLGGWVSSHYAGLACVDLPYCNGQFFPSIQWNNLNNDLIGIHMLHRLGAIIVTVYLSALVFALFMRRHMRNIAILLSILLLLQLTLGILNIVWLRPVWIALAHHAIAILLFITLLTSVSNIKHGKVYG